MIALIINKSSIFFLLFGLLVISGSVLGSRLVAWELVLCKVLTHFVEPIDRPQGQLGHFHPSVVHRFGIHHHEYQVQAVLLEGCCQTGASRWCDARFAAIEALAEKFVGVRPMVLTGLVLDVFPRALVVGAHDHFANKGVLHSDAGQLADVGGRALIVLVGKSVGVRIVGRLKSKGARVPVHLLQEILHGLV